MKEKKFIKNGYEIVNLKRNGVSCLNIRTSPVPINNTERAMIVVFKTIRGYASIYKLFVKILIISSPNIIKIILNIKQKYDQEKKYFLILIISRLLFEKPLNMIGLYALEKLEVKSSNIWLNLPPKL